METVESTASEPRPAFTVRVSRQTKVLANHIEACARGTPVRCQVPADLFVGGCPVQQLCFFDLLGTVLGGFSFQGTHLTEPRIDKPNGREGKLARFPSLLATGGWDRCQAGTRICIQAERKALFVSSNIGRVVRVDGGVSLMTLSMPILPSPLPGFFFEEHIPKVPSPLYVVFASARTSEYRH